MTITCSITLSTMITFSSTPVMSLHLSTSTCLTSSFSSSSPLSKPTILTTGQLSLGTSLSANERNAQNISVMRIMLSVSLLELVTISTLIKLVYSYCYSCDYLYCSSITFNKMTSPLYHSFIYTAHTSPHITLLS